MKRIHIPKKLYNEIKEYCEFNNLDDITKEIVNYIQTGFNLVKYGNSPFLSFNIKTNENLKEEKEEKKVQETIKDAVIEKIEKKPKKGIIIIKN